MYMDKNLVFSEGQTLAAGVSQNVIDFGTKEDGYPNAFLVVNLEKELSVAQNLTVEVQTSKEANFTTLESVATFVAKKGARNAVRQFLPLGLNRYVRLNYTVVGAPTGKITAIVAADCEVA